jgi:hypothetical protein
MDQENDMAMMRMTYIKSCYNVVLSLFGMILSKENYLS